MVALAGGVGGAKLAVGLSLNLLAENLTIIVNTGDDFQHFGLTICPDIDTVCYSLAGKADKVHGWGVENETWEVLNHLRSLGAPTWFGLGDKDLALHLERTRLLQEGWSLSDVTRELSKRLGVNVTVLPMCDLLAPTRLALLEGGELSFQSYFVRDRFEPIIERIILPTSDELIAPSSVMEAINQADLIVICPSNPWVSIDPILNIPPIRELIKEKITVAVSPIINGQALKGPAAKMFNELGIEPSASSVLEHYAHLIDGFVYDETESQPLIYRSASGIISIKTNTIMKETFEKANLAKFVLEFGLRLHGVD